MPSRGGAICPVAGLDEVGRGALAGPLVAAAVVLPWDLEPPAGIRLIDSKLLSPDQRLLVDGWIRAHAVSLAVESIDVDAINRLGIGWANRVIFSRLMARMGAGRYLVDGNLRLHGLAPAGAVVLCICDGDARQPSIAAASIVAKVHRDRLMGSLGASYPWYGWAHNAGYATQEHCRAVLEHGSCSHHRTLFLRRILLKGSS